MKLRGSCWNFGEHQQCIMELQRPLVHHMFWRTLAVVLQERLAEVEEHHRQELESVRAMAAAENSILKVQAERKDKLEVILLGGLGVSGSALT